MLWKAGYAGYEISPDFGLIFIKNREKTKQKQLKWLNKYSEALRKYGIEAKVYEEKEPYICF